MIKINSVKVDQNFYLSEFQCPCCCRVILHSDLLKYLVKLRRLIREPIYINSGYRCITENTKVGGVKGSYHLLGMAADITVKNTSMEDLSIMAKSAGFKGIGLYRTFIHVDVREYESHWEG